MRVVIVGGGIGGLACAHGLRARGVDVVVVEPDTDLARTAGYKLHLGVAATAALRGLLPPDHVERLLGSSVATRGFVITVRDHRGRRLLRATEPADGLTLDIDRTTLRGLLADGLEEHLVLGRRGTSWREDDGSVTAVLDDGTELTADLMIIADGARSALAARLAGAPTSRAIGLVGVAGRTPWSRVGSTARALLDDPMLAVGPGGTGLFATAHDPAGRAALRRSGPTGGLVDQPDPMAIWGALLLDRDLELDAPREGASASGPRLIDAVDRRWERHGWHPALRELITRADPDSVAAFGLRAADPDAIGTWPTGRVTAIGDAVHAMPPTGGQGAATAILDAHDLVAGVATVLEGRHTLRVAVHDVEAGIRRRGATAVRESLQPVTWIRRSASPVGSSVVRLATPLVAGFAALTRRARR